MVQQGSKSTNDEKRILAEFFADRKGALLWTANLTDGAKARPVGSGYIGTGNGMLGNVLLAFSAE